jgi:hypothetical protein
MAVSSNYAHPVSVNGFSCRNCSEVDLAKRHVDPAHPKDGPFGVNAKRDLARDRPDAVQFGGALAGVSVPSAVNSVPQPARLDIRV